MVFGADFIFDEGPVQDFVDETTIINPVVEDELILTSDLDLFLTNDTIRSGENLPDCFEYKKLQKTYL